MIIIIVVVIVAVILICVIIVFVHKRNHTHGSTDNTGTAEVKELLNGPASTDVMLKNTKNVSI